MPSGPFAHVCLLVHDLDKAVEDYSKILGVLDPGQLAKKLVRYDDFAGGADTGMKWATFVSDHGAEMQFIQPGPGTPLYDRLQQKGEHVHHLCFTTNDVPGAMSRLAEQNLQVLNNGETYKDPEMTWQEWSWIGPKSAHGVLIEVAQPYESRDDGKWYHAPESIRRWEKPAEAAE